MITLKILVSFFIACLLASCQLLTNPYSSSLNTGENLHTTDQPNLKIEEIVIYNSLLESKFAGRRIDQVLMFDHTRVNQPVLIERDLDNFRRNTSISDELIVNFVDQNHESHKLETNLDFGIDYQLLSQEDVDELRSLDEASGWKLFCEKYPNSYGFIYLSRVGFNLEMNQALVYISTYHYDQPIQGDYYLLEKQNGVWVIISSFGWNS